MIKKSVAKIAKIETDWSFEEAPITEARIGRRSGGSKVYYLDRYILGCIGHWYIALLLSTYWSSNRHGSPSLSPTRRRQSRRRASRMATAVAAAGPAIGWRSAAQSYSIGILKSTLRLTVVRLTTAGVVGLLFYAYKPAVAALSGCLRKRSRSARARSEDVTGLHRQAEVRERGLGAAPNPVLAPISGNSSCP